MIWLALIAWLCAIWFALLWWWAQCGWRDALALCRALQRQLNAARLELRRAERENELLRDGEGWKL